MKCKVHPPWLKEGMVKINREPRERFFFGGEK
jgi:hypothetical protein